MTTDGTSKGVGYVAGFLGVGEANAIKGEELMTLAGFNSIRALREQVEYERNHGVVILTSGCGYFLPERDETGTLTDRGAQETRRFYAQQRAKGIGTLKSARSAGALIKAYESRDQTRMPGV